MRTGKIFAVNKWNMPTTSWVLELLRKPKVDDYTNVPLCPCANEKIVGLDVSGRKEGKRKG